MRVPSVSASVAIAQTLCPSLRHKVPVPSHQPSSLLTNLQPTSIPSFSPSYSSQQSLPVQRPSEQNSNEPSSLRASPNNMVSPDDASPPSAFGFLLTIGVIVLIIFFILTRKNVNSLKRGKKGGGGEDFLNNLNRVIDNNKSEIDLQPGSDDDHRCSSGSKTRTHLNRKRDPSPTQNMDDDHSCYSDQFSTTSSHESEGDISWLGRVYRSMSVSVEEGVTWKKKFARGNKRQSDGCGSKRKRGRGDGRSEDKPSPPPKAKVHNSKLQLSGSKRR